MSSKKWQLIPSEMSKLNHLVQVRSYYGVVVFNKNIFHQQELAYYCTKPNDHYIKNHNRNKTGNFKQNKLWATHARSSQRGRIAVDGIFVGLLERT